MNVILGLKLLATGAMLASMMTALKVHSAAAVVLGQERQFPDAAPQVDSVKLDHEFDAGSGVPSVHLSPEQIENLVILGRAWGFVKYYHPRVVAGRINWDYELFRVLPVVLAAQDRHAATRAISAWLARVGDPPPCTKCAALPADLHLQPEIHWIRDQGFLGEELSRRLSLIHEGRRGEGEQYYVAQDPGVGKPTFENEAPYPRPTVPDAGYRLLAVYRLWNVVQYWYPYRDLFDEEWAGVLREFVPLVVGEMDSATYRVTMLRMIARIQDGHANLWSGLKARPPRGDGQLPVTVRFIGGEAVVAAYVDDEAGPATGLRPGDVITAVDGVSVDSLVTAWEPYYAGANRPARFRDMGEYLTRGNVGRVQVSLRREGKPVEMSLERPAMSMIAGMGPYHSRRGPPFQMLTPEVAYLKLSAFVADDVSEYITKASVAKVLVVDIRNYPNEFAVYCLGGHLVTNETPFARFTYGDLANPGAFYWTDAAALEPLAPHFSGKIVVLVDEVTQSQAEFTAMAIRAAGGVIVGSTTAGSDGDVAFFPLPGGLRTAISGIGVFYPDRSPTQRVGIIPDIEVRPTVEGLRTGRDEVLEAAVSHALGRPFRLPRH